MALREEKEFAVSGKQKDSREETNAVSDTRVMMVKSRHQKPLHPLSRRSASRTRIARQESVWEDHKNFLNGSSTKLPCDNA